MGGDATASRALVTVNVSPDQTFRLTPPSLLSGQSGYNPRINLGLPPLTLGGTPAPTFSPGFAGLVPSYGRWSQSSSSASPSSTPTPGGGGSDSGSGSSWEVLSQAVVQINAGNWSFSTGVPAPLAATTLQFNLLFSGFDNKFQIGEYISGSGSFANDGMGRVYSISWGALLGGNDLLVRGPVSFINPQLQVGPNFTNLGRPDATAQLAANISNFINVSGKGSALTVGLGGQVGYVYDFSANMSAFSASLLLQFQLQRSLGSP
jgi:hypothetical protein